MSQYLSFSYLENGPTMVCTSLFLRGTKTIQVIPNRAGVRGHGGQLVPGDADAVRAPWFPKETPMLGDCGKQKVRVPGSQPLRLGHFPGDSPKSRPHADVFFCEKLLSRHRAAAVILLLLKHFVFTP